MATAPEHTQTRGGGLREEAAVGRLVIALADAGVPGLEVFLLPQPAAHVPAPAGEGAACES